ncbi:MAG: hypothetical protein QNJ44_08880, partial [Rhodobacter sp.]|nr:hypothetical protein [Rhodobacter sp.]
LLITIPARGLEKRRTLRPDRRPRSITLPERKKLLASRAATTEAQIEQCLVGSLMASFTPNQANSVRPRPDLAGLLGG